MSNIIPCWCGNTNLTAFSAYYKHCPRCQTLVSQAWFTSNMTEVANDAQDFYGKEYWLSHQAQDLGFPDIFLRARTDLPERCLYWLRTLLKYKLPPATILELGGAHGGSVAMFDWAGFDATNLELSPWVVEFSCSTFAVPTLPGPVEQQDIADASLDVIALMDVLEHLPHPVQTIQHCLRLLKPDGVLFIQTPSFPETKTYQHMLATADPFLEQLKQEEHLYLFSQKAIRIFFQSLDVNHLTFETAIFDHYDMFLIASRAPITVQKTETITRALSRTAGGRLIQALIDLDDQRRDLYDRYTALEVERSAQLDYLQHLEQTMLSEEAQPSAQAAKDKAPHHLTDNTRAATDNAPVGEIATPLASPTGTDSPIDRLQHLGEHWARQYTDLHTSRQQIHDKYQDLEQSAEQLKYDIQDLANQVSNIPPANSRRARRLKRRVRRATSRPPPSP